MLPFFYLIIIWVTGIIVASGLMGLLMAAGLDIQNTSNLMWMQTLSQIISLLIPALLYWWFYGRKEQNFFHLTFNKTAWMLALVGITTLLLLQPTVDWAGVWNDSLHLPQSMQTLEDTMRNIGKESEHLLDKMLMRTEWYNLAINLIVIALVPAICEELFFRGALQQSLQRWTSSKHWAIVITAFIFAVAHGEMFAIMPRFILGMLLGYLFVASGSMLVNSMAHFFNNGLIVVLYYLYACGKLGTSPGEPLDMSLSITLTTLAAATALFVVYMLPRLRSSNKAGNTERQQ